MKQRILNFLLKHLYNAVTEESFLTVKGDKIYGGEKELDRLTVLQYASEARAIRKMSLYRAMNKHYQAAANKHMYMSSKNLDDLNFGKATLWVVDTYDKKLISMSAIKETTAPLKETEMKPLKTK